MPAIRTKRSNQRYHPYARVKQGQVHATVEISILQSTEIIIVCVFWGLNSKLTIFVARLLESLMAHTQCYWHREGHKGVFPPSLPQLRCSKD
jgi:hypothetical protein